jgi:hypothetical protein
VLRHDDAFAFQFQVCPLDRDYADLKIDSKLTNGRNSLACGPVSDSNPLYDLLHDLEVDRALVRLRDGEGAAHLYILSILSCEALSRHY